MERHEREDIKDSSNGMTLPMLQLMAQAMDHTLQGIILTNAEGTILYVNPAFTMSTGYTTEEAIGQKPSILQSGMYESDFYSRMWGELKESGQWQGEIWNRKKNGELFAEWLNVSAIRSPLGQVTHYCAVFTEITERKLLESKLKAEFWKLEELSLMDPLTRIGNRRAFDLRIQKEWDRALQRSSPLSLLIIDVDFFKPYNDIYGHMQGDEALRRVASALKESLPSSVAMAARIGGEEFAVVLPETALEGAVIAGQVLRENVAQLKIPHKGSSASPYVTISIGCSTYVPGEGDRFEELLQSADKALYSAKEKGRNRVQIGA